MHPLWLCLRLPSLPLEALPLPGDGPGVVFERHRQRPASFESGRRHSGNALRKLLVCGNPAAEALGLTPGIELGSAAALAPQLKALERNPRAEREALRVLAGACYAFSSQVTVQPGAPESRVHSIWLEVAGSLGLFGGLEALCARLRQGLAALGHRAELGIAPTLEGASLLAGLPPALDRAALWHALGPLPLSRLPVSDEAREALKGSGLRTLGEVLALPLDALARRFAPAFTDWLGRLTGRLPDARRLYRPPDHYRRKLEFAGEVETTEGLRFPIRRLLAELAACLVARDAGASAFTLELEHETGAPSRLEVGLASPSRDAAHLQLLAQSRLEQLRVRAPVQALVLRVEHFAPVRMRQFDLFDPRSAEEDEWRSVLDRMRARLGAAAVQGLGLHADHRPEKAWVRVPAVTAPAGSKKGVRPRMDRMGSRAAVVGAAHGRDPTPRERPLWLLPEPRALVEAPKCLRGPERIEGGWWDGADAQRDYYVAETGEGARLWVYREAGGRWFLHGLWA